MKMRKVAGSNPVCLNNTCVFIFLFQTYHTERGVLNEGLYQMRFLFLFYLIFLLSVIPRTSLARAPLEP